MPDREKVLKGLECCSQMTGEACRKCPYSSECVAGEATYQTGTAHLASDALALLKEQEPVKPVNIHMYSKMYANVRSGYCPICNKAVDEEEDNNFCCKCGRAIKWDD